MTPHIFRTREAARALADWINAMGPAVLADVALLPGGFGVVRGPYATPLEAWSVQRCRDAGFAFPKPVYIVFSPVEED